MIKVKKKKNLKAWLKVRFYKGIALLSELNNSEDKFCTEFLKTTIKISGRRLGWVSENIFTTPNQK